MSTAPTKKNRKRRNRPTTSVSDGRDRALAIHICNEMENKLAECAGLDAPNDLFQLIEFQKEFIRPNVLILMHKMRQIRNHLAHDNRYQSIFDCTQSKRIKSAKDFEDAWELVQSEIDMVPVRRARAESANQQEVASTAKRIRGELSFVQVFALAMATAFTVLFLFELLVGYLG